MSHFVCHSLHIFLLLPSSYPPSLFLSSLPLLMIFPSSPLYLLSYYLPPSYSIFTFLLCSSIPPSSYPLLPSFTLPLLLILLWRTRNIMREPGCSLNLDMREQRELWQNSVLIGAHVQALVHLHRDGYVYTYKHVCIRTYIRNVYIYKHIHTYIHKYVYTCAHAYIHTYIYICIYRYSFLLSYYRLHIIL